MRKYSKETLLVISLLESKEFLNGSLTQREIAKKVFKKVTHQTEDRVRYHKWRLYNKEAFLKRFYRKKLSTV